VFEYNCREGSAVGSSISGAPPSPVTTTTTTTTNLDSSLQIPDADVTLDVYLVVDYDAFGYVQSGRIRCRTRADGNCRCAEIAEDKADP
jgi:hypothetical protein